MQIHLECTIQNLAPEICYCFTEMFFIVKYRSAQNNAQNNGSIQSRQTHHFSTTRIHELKYELVAAKQHHKLTGAHLINGLHDKTHSVS